MLLAGVARTSAALLVCGCSGRTHSRPLSSEDRLRAYVHAMCLKRLAVESIEEALYNRQKLDREKLSDLTKEVLIKAKEYGYSSFFSKLKRSSWNIKRVYLKDQEFRYDWNERGEGEREERPKKSR